MKNILITLLLIFGLISAQFSQYFVVAGFNLNRSYIAEKLCVNKSRPWLHCNGRCYLMKKLKQSADNEKAAERENKKNTVQQIFYSCLHGYIFHTCLLSEINTPYVYNCKPYGLKCIFQPPRA